MYRCNCAFCHLYRFSLGFGGSNFFFISFFHWVLEVQSFNLLIFDKSAPARQTFKVQFATTIFGMVPLAASVHCSNLVWPSVVLRAGSTVRNIFSYPYLEIFSYLTSKNFSYRTGTEKYRTVISHQISYFYFIRIIHNILSNHIKICLLYTSPSPRDA